MIKREDGVVIIAVLWICALIMWLALQIGAEARLQGEEQVHLFRKSQALYLAIGGCYEALARMGQAPPVGLELSRTRSNAEGENWQPNGVVHHVRYSTGEAVVVVEAEGLKVNVNKSNPEQIRAVVEKAGVEGDAAEALADVIADFIDKDDIPRLQGAEKDRYRQLGLPYVPFNGPLTSLDQMLLIPGISQQLFYGYGREGNGLGQDETGSVDEPLFPKKHSLFDMFSVYGNNLILRQDEPAAGTGQKRITWENGGIYRILSCGKPSAGSPSVLVWLIVRYVPQGRNGYEVLYRKIL